MLSYAGVSLSLATPKLSLAIESAISPHDIYSDFDRLDWPGPSVIDWTFPAMVKHRPIKTGTLYWPRDASRWATGYFLATDNQLTQIRNVIGSNYSAQPLLLSREDQNGDTVASIAPLMWMLPPRPLFQIEGANGLWLCTFVDDRYFWWFRDTGDIAVTSGVTTWANLYNSVATALSISLTNDAISANYLTPASVLASRYELSPLLLDAIAYNVGQRIVHDWDTGDVFAYGPTTSSTIIDNNLAGDWPVMGGGAFALNPNLPNDIQALLPGTVRVTFPQSSAGVATGDVYAVTQNLGALNLVDLGSRGNNNTKTFHDTCAATYTSSAQPSNAATLQALAQQIATDWYRQQLAPIETKFVGIVPWEVEGLSDAIEWTYRKGEVSTRIYRSPWNDLTEELLHGPNVPAPPAWVKVTSATPQTVTLPGGATISGYPALVDTWGATSGNWTDSSDAVWFIGANAEIPANGTRYQCRLLGVDGSGVAIWATVISATTPATYSASGTHTLTSTAGQSTGIAITITTAGLYFVTCSIPGEYSHSVGAGNSESLQCWLALSSGSFPMNYVTVACVNNPTGGAYASPSTSYGTACITGYLNVTSPPLTITLWTQIAGALALGTAIIGTTQNNALNSPALLSAVQIP